MHQVQSLEPGEVVSHLKLSLYLLRGVLIVETPFRGVRLARPKLLVISKNSQIAVLLRDIRTGVYFGDQVNASEQECFHQRDDGVSDFPEFLDCFQNAIIYILERVDYFVLDEVVALLDNQREDAIEILRGEFWSDKLQNESHHEYLYPLILDFELRLGDVVDKHLALFYFFDFYLGENLASQELSNLPLILDLLLNLVAEWIDIGR